MAKVELMIGFFSVGRAYMHAEPLIGAHSMAGPRLRCQAVEPQMGMAPGYGDHLDGAGKARGERGIRATCASYQRLYGVRPMPAQPISRCSPPVLRA